MPSPDRIVRTLQVALLIALALHPAKAAADDQWTFVTVSLNGEPQADVMVIRSDDDVWLPVEYLDVVGVRAGPGQQRTVDGRPLVSLESLRPAIAYHFDEASVGLALTVAAEQLVRQGVYDVARDRPVGLERARNSSVFLNYAATAHESLPGAYAAELGMSLRGVLLSASAALQGDSLQRGPTRATIDNERRLVRVELGDTVATSGALGDGLDIAGISIARQFEIDPYYVSQAPLRLRGVAATPSTAEVYINGQLVRRVPVAPGSFELTGVTAPIGAGQTEVVVRDAFGREQQFQSAFYQPLSVLEQGLHQFRYAIGVPRLDRLRQWDYSQEPVATGEHRYGLGSRVTIGGRFEASRDLIAGGPGVAVALPIGEIEAEAGVSRLDGTVGMSGLLGYRYQARTVSVGVRGLAGGRDYATLGSTLFTRRRNKLSTQTFAGTSFGRVSLTATHIYGSDWDGNRLERLDLISSLRLNSRMTLMVTGSRNRFGGPRYEGFASLSIGLGRNSVMNFTAAQDSDRPLNPGVTLQRSLGRGPGYGYQVQWSQRSDHARFAAATLQHQLGRVELRHDGFEEGGASATVSGSIVGVGGRVFATRPVTDAFALVRVPDTPGVRVYSSNQLMGRTDRSGDLVVPDVISYYGNNVSIDPTDLPLTSSPARETVLVAPSFRAGGLALFQVSEVNPVTGRLVIVTDTATVVPAFADVFVAGVPNAQSPIGKGGAFFFDNLPAGPARLVGQYKGQSFACDVLVPAASDILIRDLGLVQCVPDENEWSTWAIG